MTSFHCQNCGSVTDISSMLSAFDHNPHCSTCGLSVSEIDTKMQDELSDLLASNMHLGSMQVSTHDVSMPPTPQVVPQAAPTTYVSQHYHHSSHMVPTTPSSEYSASTVLRNAGVNTDCLLPSQLQLFKNAQQDQRDRLVELWRIAPPRYGDQLASQEMGNWPQTSLELEEEAARLRWEKQEQVGFKGLSVLPGQDDRNHAEPYMHEGYDAEMSVDEAPQEHRPATDPVYSREREWWHMSADGQPIEHQYGMLQQMQMLHGSCGFDRNHLQL